MLRIKAFFFVSLSTVLMLLPLVLGSTQRALAIDCNDPNVISADCAKNNVCSGLSSGTDCASNPKGVTVNSAIKAGVEILSFVVGILAVVMLIVGGVKYITSGGDSNRVNSAKNTVLYAIIGLVIAALAQVIARFLLNRVG
jgi:hypothetical protein